MGRHAKKRDGRRRPPWAATAAVFPALAVAAAAVPRTAPAEPPPPAVDAPTCCVEVVAMPAAPAPQTYAVIRASSGVAEQNVPASRWRVVDTRPVLLARGVAPEARLQVRTILVARAISATFPEIRSIGGWRQDALRWHPGGLAIDVMIPNAGTAAGTALGNRIVAFVLRNAQRFGMQDAIWRGVYYTPGGASGSGHGHFDHVHITTTGGGYPDGDEIYVR